MLYEPLTLIKINSGFGASATDTEEKTDVFCELSILGTKTKMGALAANVKLEAAVIIWTDELQDYTHAELRGKRYKIENTVQMDKVKTKLYLGGINQC